MTERSADPDGAPLEGERVCVAAIAGAFGVRGEVRLKPFTAEPAAVGAYGPLETEDRARRFGVRVTRPVKGGMVAARLSGVDTREAAEALRGVRLYAPRAALPPPDDDEFYYADLIGLAVVDQAERALGRVSAVQNYGAGDFLEIVAPDRASPILMPFTQEAIPIVDIAGGRLVADPPVGVFDEDPEPEAGGADG